jgi:hypothetical protein
MKDWVTRNQDNASELGDMPTRNMLLQRASTTETQFSILFSYKADIILFSLNETCSRHEKAD